MNNENNNNGHIPTVHDFDYDLICEYFLGFERQGPGNREMTLRALSFIDGLDESSCIADLGCGTGGQTMTLAAATKGRITGIDLFPAFVDLLNEQAREHGICDRVHGTVGTMEKPPLGKGLLDLIWCEGAIYNIGFERGLREWRDYLRRGGYVAVTENTWFTDERPAEIEEFWQAAYPEIDTIPAKIAAIQRAGYEFVAAFALPESVWADYYAAQSAKHSAFLKRHADTPFAEQFISTQKYEKSLWNKYKAYYGYVFYIGKKK